MKYILIITFTLFMFINSSEAVTSLTKGVTLGDWLSTAEAVYVQTTRYTKTDFEDIKSLGCDHVRILVNFNTSENTAPDYNLSPIYYNCLDKAIIWAQEVGLKVVIAAQGFDIATGNWEIISQQLADNWKDMAAHFAGQGDIVLYELLASPGSTITSDLWGSAANVIVSAIREVDSKHTIIYGPVNYSVDNLSTLTKIADDNVLYAFEFYDPITFTRQGTDYAGITYNSVVIPFPYNAAKMPAMDDRDAGTEAETAFNNYPANGNVDYVKSRLDLASQFATANSVPVYCTSFGVQVGTQWSDLALQWDIPAADRAAWLETVRTYLEGHSTGWCLTSYRDNFGIFRDYSLGSEEWMHFSNFKYDINTVITTALGMTAATPAELTPIELTGDLVLYDDEVTPLARINYWLGDLGYPDFFVSDNPAVGKYCLGIYYPDWYGYIETFFPVYLDMEKIMDKGYLLDFFIRCDNPLGHLQVRFIDTNLDFEDKPWRMNYQVDDTVVPFNGDWQRVTIVMADMVDMGAWETDNLTWTEGPGGLFDWSSVQSFQFVSENEAQPETEIFVDRVRIVSPTAIDKKTGENPNGFRLEANYPNPFNASTVFEFSLPDKEKTQLSVYNVQGQLVRTLVSSTLNAGVYQYSWNGDDGGGNPMPSGVYFYELKTDNQKLIRQMALIR
jgi:endoglucanase